MLRKSTYNAGTGFEFESAWPYLLREVAAYYLRDGGRPMCACSAGSDGDDVDFLAQSRIAKYKNTARAFAKRKIVITMDPQLSSVVDVLSNERANPLPGPCEIVTFANDSENLSQTAITRLGLLPRVILYSKY